MTYGDIRCHNCHYPFLKDDSGVRFSFFMFCAECGKDEEMMYRKREEVVARMVKKLHDL